MHEQGTTQIQKNPMLEDILQHPTVYTRGAQICAGEYRDSMRHKTKFLDLHNFMPHEDIPSIVETMKASGIKHFYLSYAGSDAFRILHDLLHNGCSFVSCEEFQCDYRTHLMPRLGILLCIEE